MNQAVFDVLSALEMRDEKERLQNLPGEQRIRALHPDAARFLYITALAAKAKNIVEVGTSRGYSTIWLALVAQKNGGKVITCEINPNHAAEAQANFEKAGLSDVIEIIVGDARDTLRSQTGSVDLLFMDAEKEQYETYFDVVYKRIAVGGLCIADNALSHADDLLDYISYVQNHPNLESVTVPIGRGLEMTVKVSG